MAGITRQKLSDNFDSEALMKTILCEYINGLTVQADEFTEPVFEFSVPAGQGCGAVSLPRQLTANVISKVSETSRPIEIKTIYYATTFS